MEQTLEWVIAGALIGVLLLMSALHYASRHKNRELINYALLLLLEDKIYAVQRAGLAKFVSDSAVRNAQELKTIVYRETTELAKRLSANGDSSTAIGVLLWELKKMQVAPESSSD